MNFRIHSTLYFATGISFIALEAIGATWPEIIVKVFIIPLLIWLYASHAKGSMNRFHRMIIVALLFSWGGDMLLQLSQFNETLFLVGVGSFLVTHLMIQHSQSQIQMRYYPLYMLVMLWCKLQ